MRLEKDGLISEPDGILSRELEFYCKDGRTIVLDCTFQFIRDEQGKATGILAEGKDITERKRAEEALHHQNEMLRTILDSIPVMVAFFDREGHYQLVNCCWQSTLGWSLEKAQEKDVFADLSPPAGTKFLGGFFPGARRIWEFFKNKTHDGRVCLTSSVLMRPPVGAIIFVVIDITDRKQAEEALRRAEENFRRSLDDSPLGVRIVTIEGETIYANRAILDIYGYDSIEELRTTPLKERYTPESYAEFQIRKEKRKRGGDEPSEYDISIVRKDGEVRHLQVFRKEILWNGERQFQVIYQDITGRIRAESEIRPWRSSHPRTPIRSCALPGMARCSTSMRPA